MIECIENGKDFAESEPWDSSKREDIRMKQERKKEAKLVVSDEEEYCDYDFADVSSA
jgi:hypothetical protein